MKRHLFRRMGRFLRPQAPSLAGAAALAALSGLLALLVPLVAGWAVEAIGTGPGAADLTAVLRCCAAGLGAAVLSAVCSYGASAALVRVGQTVSYTLRKAAFQQITQLPVRYFDTHPAGDLISRVCYDVDTVNAALSIDLLQIGTSLLTVIGSFVMLLMLSPLLSGVFFLTVPLSVLLTRLQMKHIHPLFRRRSQELGALNSFAEERVSCQRAIRVYGVEAADLRQFAEKNDAASETYYKADCASTALGPSVNFINNLSLAAVSVFGALLYLGGGLRQLPGVPHLARLDVQRLRPQGIAARGVGQIRLQEIEVVCLALAGNAGLSPAEGRQKGGAQQHGNPSLFHVWPPPSRQGQRTVKTAPPPGRLAASTVPPRFSTVSLTMANPRPVPPAARDRALSTR